MTPAASGWAAAADAVAHVFVEDLGDRIQVEGADGHHLQRVRRLGVGERVTAAPGSAPGCGLAAAGAGTWRPYEIVGVGAARLDLQAIGPVRCEPGLAPGLVVAFAPAAGSAADRVVAQLTELGVDGVLVLATRRGVVRWAGDRLGRSIERLGRVAREAAVQCRRARLPSVAAASLPELTGRPGLVVADRSGGSVAELADPGPSGWLVVVGPEGGFEDGELELLAGAPRLAVGPHVLRAATAPVAVAGALTTGRRPRVDHCP